MDYSIELQRMLNVIDERITDKLSVNELAQIAGFSPWHFCRIFQAATGYSIMCYVIKRKLEFALVDLGIGKKVIDAAVVYGFETHAGFTKAFKRYFGYSPATYRLRVGAADLPSSVLGFQNKLSGGNAMSPQLLEIKPFTIAGYPNHW
jgi:AraC family transcriptional regulator